MGATFPAFKIFASLEILTASDFNASLAQFLTNLTPAGVDDASTDVAAMRVQTDPFPAGAPSLATALQGEIERLRFQVKQLNGTTYWYEDPVAVRVFLLPELARLAAVVGASLVSDDASAESWKFLNFADGVSRTAEWLTQARAFSSVRIGWLTPGITGNVSWAVEVREKGDASALGGGTVVAEASLAIPAPGSPQQFDVQTIPLVYTPSGTALAIVVKVFRDATGGNPTDTLSDTAQLAWVELL